MIGDMLQLPDPVSHIPMFMPTGIMTAKVMVPVFTLQQLQTYARDSVDEYVLSLPRGPNITLSGPHCGQETKISEVKPELAGVATALQELVIAATLDLDLEDSRNAVFAAVCRYCDERSAPVSGKLPTTTGGV